MFAQFVAATLTATLLLTPGGQPVGGRWQSIIAASREPTPPVAVTFDSSDADDLAVCNLAPACIVPPSFSPAGRPSPFGVSGVTRPEIWVEGTYSLARFGELHELGHLFDWYYLTPRLRWWFKWLMGDTRKTWTEYGTPGGGASDDFAEMYGYCALNRGYTLSSWPTGGPEWGVASICNLIRRIGHGFSRHSFVHPTPLALAKAAAIAYWGRVPCGGAVTISYAPEADAPQNATDGVPVSVLWAWTVFDARVGSGNLFELDYAARPSTYTNCTITLDSDVWQPATEASDFPDFCGLIVHEYGHLLSHPDEATDAPTSITYPIIGPLNEHVAPCTARYAAASAAFQR